MCSAKTHNPSCKACFNACAVQKTCVLHDPSFCFECMQAAVDSSIVQLEDLKRELDSSTSLMQDLKQQVAAERERYLRRNTFQFVFSFSG